MHVRRYKPGEEEKLWQIYFDTTHIINGRLYTKAQTERWAPKNQNMNEWQKRIEQRNPFVALQNNEIIGFAELEPNGHIDYFYAHHLWQGKGVGTMLYKAIETEAIYQKMPKLFAEVSLLAKEFFLKHGFVLLEEKNTIICGAPAPNFIMQKKLQID